MFIYMLFINVVHVILSTLTFYVNNLIALVYIYTHIHTHIYIHYFCYYKKYDKMGKRYYCDYCDRSFKDDPEARRKHLSSLQHAKNRADHYSFYKDPETILQEEQGKIPCKRYMSSGDCAFGSSCKFSHYAPSLIWELQHIVAVKQMAASHFRPQGGWPNPDDIVKEFFVDITNPDTTEEFTYPIWDVPPELHNYPNLPPSLWPVTPESLTDSNFAQWS